VKADGPKRSSFRALVASGYYEDLPTLRAFSTANGKVFLPDRVTPDAHALHTFSQIADRGAHLFGGLRENASHGLLIAAGGHVPDGAADRSGSIWYLRLLSFQDFVVLQPPRPDEATHFENVSLKSSKDVLDWLKNRIIDAAQNKHELIGYTMELRTTRYINPDDRKLERLRQKEADIREEINWVSSIAQPRPHLLRFTQNQLTAMVDVLRSYPMSALSNGQLLYGYTSDQITPEGHHYLYIRPQLIRIHGDPMARWENLNDSPMRFWIDPFWGDHYFGVSRSQVFVPQNSSLFPAIHTEKAEEMDKYLEMIMKRWYHGKGPVLSVPETPIYVFAPLPGDENKVRVSLLNFKGLKPLKAQLGWLNKTLEIMDDQGTKDFIEKVSVIHKRESILSNLTKEAAEADRCFKATAESVRVQIARHTEDLTELVTEELNQVIIETQDTTTGLKDLDKRLRDLRDLCVDLENLADASKREVSSTEAKIREVETYTSNLAKHAAEEIRQAEAVREGTTKRLEGQIQQMKASRDHLRKMLKS
jgi:hypothetical protein